MKKFILIISILLFAFATQAQSDSLSEKSLLWKISGNGLKQASYIFGTVHIIPKEDYFFTDIMKQKFDSCKKLVLEVDINLPLSEQINAVKKMMLPKGKTLSDYMTEEEFSEFQSYLLDTLKIKESTFNKIQKIKPVFSSVFIIKDAIGKSKTYEEELNKRAKKNDMSVEGLETLDFQINLINNISIEDQVSMLTETESSKNPIDAYYKLIDIYKKQDTDSLRILIDADDSTSAFGDDLLKNRNIDWISKIEKLINENPVFIAAGAGHLAGKDGILNLLREQGYTVEPVK